MSELVTYSGGVVDVSDPIEMWPKTLRWYHRERMYELDSGFFRRVWNPDCMGGQSCFFPATDAIKWFVDHGYDLPSVLRPLVKS